MWYHLSSVIVIVLSEGVTTIHTNIMIVYHKMSLIDMVVIMRKSKYDRRECVSIWDNENLVYIRGRHIVSLHSLNNKRSTTETIIIYLFYCSLRVES